MSEPVALAWSGGKDSALALAALRRGDTTVSALVTTFTADYDRVSIHGVRRALVRDQAAAAGVPLVEVDIPAACSEDVYADRMEAALRSQPLAPLAAVASGDLYLEEVRAYREERLRRVGKTGLFPLWGRDTATLAPSSRSCRRASTRAGRTASSTPSSMRGRASSVRCSATSANASFAATSSSRNSSRRRPCAAPASIDGCPSRRPSSTSPT